MPEHLNIFTDAHYYYLAWVYVLLRQETML